MALNILERLKSKTRINLETNCWLYEGGNDGRKGYGKIRFNKIKIAVHRVSAHLYLGLDLNNSNIQALHKHDICSFKNCWNPEHLYIGTREDNVRDNVLYNKLVNRRTKYTQNRFCRKNLHIFDENNTGIDHRGRRFCKECYRISHRNIR